MKNTKQGQVIALLIAFVALILIAAAVYMYTPKQRIVSEPSPTATTTTETTNRFVHTSTHVTPSIIEVKPLESWTLKYPKTLTLPTVRNSVINNELSLEKLTLSTLEEIQEFQSGVTEVDYNVDYDSNDVLSLSVFTDFIGAYPTFSTKHYAFNLKTGKAITPTDIFYSEKMNSLLAMINKRLEANIAAALNQSDTLMDGSCSAEEIKTELDTRHSKIQFTAKDLDFSIKENGIEFTFPFGFPHVMKACEPDQIEIIPYSDLKEYIAPEGVLGHLVR